MVVSVRGSRLKQTQTNTQQLTNKSKKILGSLVGGLSMLSTVMLAIPAQAQSLLTEKPASIDKSTLQFEQAHYEQQRLEAQRVESLRIDQAQARFSRLRARLLSPSSRIETVVSPASGTYLYGQQPVHDQPNTAYFVFESQGTHVVGALYMPSSSFDCAEGHISEGKIALSVTDSYSQERFAYALALNDSLGEVASQAGAVIAPPSIEGFYPLPIQESDRALLATCQAI
ncbi:MAG: hypothetical protein AAFO84_13745 [Cyanobacteria bacterium J06598_1]